MKLIVAVTFIFLLIGSHQAQAKLFKCTSSEGRTSYQPTPCAQDDDTKPLDIEAVGNEPPVVEDSSDDNTTSTDTAERDSPLEALKRSREEARADRAARSD